MGSEHIQRITKVAPAIPQARGNRVQTGLVALETKSGLAEWWGETRSMQLPAKWRKSFHKGVVRSDKHDLEFPHCVLVITATRHLAQCMAYDECLIMFVQRKTKERKKKKNNLSKLLVERKKISEGLLSTTQNAETLH